MFPFFRKRTKLNEPRYLISGLGNPGEKYEGTRHNIGFEILYHFQRKFQFPEFVKKRKGLYSSRDYDSHSVILLLPQTYMNDSGLAVGEYITDFQINLENLLIIHDDMDLELGRMRYRQRGSSGGHNGLKSIEDFVESSEYKRLKFGIGRGASEEVLDYVLGRWCQDETGEVKKRIEHAVEGINLWHTTPEDREHLNNFLNQ